MDRADILYRMVDALYAVAGWDEGFPTGNRHHDRNANCWWFEQVIGGRAFLYNVTTAEVAVNAKTTTLYKVHRLRAAEWSAWVVDDANEPECEPYSLATHDLDGNVEQFERDAVLLILAKPLS